VSDKTRKKITKPPTVGQVLFMTCGEKSFIIENYLQIFTSLLRSDRQKK